MPKLGRFARELRALMWKPKVADEVRDELRYHLDEMEADLIARGVPPDEARQAAQRRFGNLAKVTADCETIGTERDRVLARHEWWHELRADVRQSVRQLRAAPRFTIAAIVTLAIGLGASTLIFGVANTVLLRPLPFPSADELSLVLEQTPKGEEYSLSEPNFLDLAARTRAFQSLGAFAPRTPALTGDGDPEQLIGAAVTATFFSVLGVTPQMGRTVSVDEARRGGDARVAVISHALWQRRFGGDHSILGQKVGVDGTATEIIGVMPGDFDFPGRTDIWTPLALSSASSRGDRRLIAVGRLASGMTMTAADGEMQQIGRDLAAAYPESNTDWSAQARPLNEWFVSPRLQARVLALLATVGLLLLMACINVANLLLARAATREREMAVRAALGAGRGRIVRQLLTESLVLASLGSVAGVLVAWVSVPIVAGAGSAAIPRLAELTLDLRVLGFAVLACGVTGLVFGLAPALRLARAAGGNGDRLHDAIRSGARVADSGRLRNGLIVTSVALAMVLLVSAGLVGSSFVRLMRADLGFAPAQVVAGSVSLPPDRYNAERAARFISEATRRLRAIPGVADAAATNIAPLSGGSTSMGFEAAETKGARVEDYRTAAWRTITPSYFSTLGITVQRGRAFDDTDVWPAPQTVIISESLSRQAWPQGDPLGRMLALSNGQELRVVGVVADTRHVVLDSTPGPTMFFSHRQFPWPQMWLTVRTTGDASTIMAEIRREVAAIDPLIPVAQLRPLSAMVSDTASEPRLTMLIFGIFATAAIVLASVGLYGIVSYSVAQRTREIGVSLALGAPPQRIVRRVMAEGARLAVIGVALGTVGGLAATGALQAILYETRTNDPWIFATVAALLCVVAMVASAGPARNASRLDPVIALRSD